MSVIVLFGLLLVNRESRFVQNTYFLSKITDWSLQSETFQRRLEIWKSAYKGILANPVFGFGRENFHLVFEEHYNPNFYIFQSAEQWMDRAHNVLLDELIFGGIIGVAAEIIFIGFIIVISIKYFRKTDDILVPIFFVFLLSYLAQAMFTLDTMGTYIPLALILGIITIHSQTNVTPVLSNISRFVIAIALLLLFLPGAKYFTVDLARASYQNARAILLSPEYLPEFLEANKKIEDLLDDKNTFKAELLSFQAFSLNQSGASYWKNSKIQPFYEYLLPRLQQVSALHPRFLRLNANYGYSLATKARYDTNKDNARIAIEYWESLADRYPTHQTVLLTLSILYDLNGRYEQAKTLLDRVLTLTPRSGSLRWSLGISFIVLKRFEEGIKLLTQGLDLGYKPTSEHLETIIVTANLATQNKKILIYSRDLYQLALRLKPNDANLHANLAYVYGKLGEKAAAIEEAKKAAELSPAHRGDIEKFIRSL